MKAVRIAHARSHTAHDTPPQVAKARPDEDGSNDDVMERAQKLGIVAWFYMPVKS